MNSIIFCLHVTAICTLTLLALRFGLGVMTAWLSLLAVAMNLFALKQITLFSLNVTSADALSVGYLLGLNLIQEYFGRKMAKKTIWISLFIAGSFLILSSIHLLYTPAGVDWAQPHFAALLTPVPRLICASLLSFWIVQLFDLSLFSFLRKKTQGKYFAARTVLSLVASQILDTVLFSYLGLYGLVDSIGHILLFSLAVKLAVILISTPFVAISKKVVHVQV